MRAENTKKKSVNKIKYSEYDSRKVTEALDYILDLRDDYLWETIFRGCKLGYIRRDEAYPVSETNAGKGNNAVWRGLKKIPWIALFCIVGWYKTVKLYDRISDAYIYAPEFFWFMATVFIALWVCIYMEVRKRIRNRGTKRKEEQDIVFLGKEECGKKGAGYRLRKLLRRKSTWHVILCTVLPWCIIKYFFFPGTGDLFLDVLILGIIYAVCFGVYRKWLGRKSIMIHDLPWPVPMFWEDRTDVKEHLWTTEKFLGISANIASWKLEEERCAELRVPASAEYKGVRYHAKKMLEYACELSMLRCLCLFSEEVRRFVDRCGGDGGRIEFRVYNVESEGVYKGWLSGSVIEEQDTVVPVETKAVRQDFVLPSPVGKRVLREFQKNGTLQLDVWDQSYEKAAKYLEENKVSLLFYKDHP